jgi:hypothetical protein
MKLTNKTQYNNRELKQLMTEIFASEGVVHTGYEVTVVYCRTGLSGRAGIGKKWIRMRLPKESCSLRLFTDVFIHEIMHTLGMRHERNGLMSCHYDPKDYADDTEKLQEVRR